MGGALAHYEGIKALSETDQTDNLKAITAPIRKSFVGKPSSETSALLSAQFCLVLSFLSMRPALLIYHHPSAMRLVLWARHEHVIVS